MDSPAGELRIKRIYERSDPADGFRVLVDRLWPRGMTSERAALDLWLPPVAPSHELRKWWKHDPEKLDEFSARYSAELDEDPAVGQLRDLLDVHPVVTLLYAARQATVNHAAVLQRYLEERQSTDWLDTQPHSLSRPPSASALSEDREGGRSQRRV